MDDEQAAALAAAATDGVVFDGLRVERTASGYRFETPAHARAGLDAAGLREVAADHPAFVTNWYYWTRVVDVEGAGYDFLRWVERAEERGPDARHSDLAGGTTRTWGELAITVRLTGGGARAYDLRHAADENAPATDLDVRADPLDARDIARFDARGRYRPLKTAPTLPTGWAFAGLDGRELVRAVDCFYPATVANWHRERLGDLDVSHWRETAERQTGIYDVVDELSPEAVARAAEACCVDSQCLKRRRWEFDEDAPIDADPGDGAFPCREPCSLLIAAAREWALIEREDTRTYEVELAPSERKQLEELIDAVSEGRVDEIREADLEDGANRYRARYLRAKLFDEEGNLGGVPAHTEGGGAETGDADGLGAEE